MISGCVTAWLQGPARVQSLTESVIGKTAPSRAAACAITIEHTVPVSLSRSLIVRSGALHPQVKEER